MALLWIATSLLIGLWHITALPTIFATIFRCAFGWQEAAAGAVGYTISQALTSGFQRGMFSNEAGMGSSPNAAAGAASWPPHPAAQGIVQMIGVFIDTIVICTASAIIVMLAPRPDNEYTLNGIQDLQHAMSVLVGGWGAGFIALIVLLFAFSSIVANYVYAENNLVFLRLDKPRYIWGLRILTVLMVLLGTMVSLPVVWQSADIIMALMAMTNLTAILLLSPTVRIIASDYLRRGGWVSSRLSMPLVTRILTNSWPRAPGMNCRANSAAIAAIDPTMHFFFVKIRRNYLQGLDMLILISPAKTLDYQARWQRLAIPSPNSSSILSSLSASPVS